MTKFQKISVFLLRIAMGFLFSYAGISKLLNPQWTAEGYLKGAKTLPSFYTWLASPEIINITNFLNEWGLTLIGISLVFGLFTRISSAFGIGMMILYYIPVLSFPYVGTHSFIIDEHIIYSLILFLLISIGAGRIWGLDQWCAKLPWCKKHKGFRKIFG